MKNTLAFLLAFFQRLTSPVGQANVKQAWLEFTLLVGCLTALIAAFKAKDFSAIIQQGQTFYIALVAIIFDIRMILSSNEKAIASSELPKVTGSLEIQDSP